MKRAALTSAAIVITALVAVLVARRGSAPEPVYDGKPVSAWALALKVASTRTEAERVLRAAGSNAVPALVHLLQTPDPVLARPIKAIGRRVPERTGRGVFRMVDPFEAGSKRAAAAEALRIVGPQAGVALPALTRALRDDNAVAWHAALALAQLGPAGVAALTNALTRSTPTQAGIICYALGTEGSRAADAIPALSTVLRAGSAEAAAPAARALSAMGRRTVPVLEDCLSHSNLHVRVCAAEALGRMGPWARPAVPKLVAMAEQDESLARSAATNALAQIGGSAKELVNERDLQQRKQQ